MKRAYYRWTIGSAAIAALLASSVGRGAEKSPYATFKGACSSAETWSWGTSGAFREDFAQELQQTISGTLAPVRGFAEAIGLRRMAQSPESMALSEYWVSRSLYQSNLVHIAALGFAAVASKEMTPETAAAQTASLECLVRIHQQHPSITLPISVTAKLAEYRDYAKGTRNASVVADAAHAVLRAHLAEEKPVPAQVEKAIALMAGNAAHEFLAKGFWAARRGDHTGTTQSLQKFFEQPVIPESLRRYTDTAHMLMARAMYTRGNPEGAAERFKLVNKRSNELAESLSELSWAYLQADKYAEAIGTATNLQAGGLRNTWAPEGPMVMSMALNELCQYPESLRASQLYRKFYDQSYRWLSHWRDSPTRDSEPLYPLAVDFLKKRGKTPARISSEWVRSPVFIANQDGVNLLFDESESNSKLGLSGASEQTRMGREIVKQIMELKPKVKAARAKLKPADPLPEKLVTELRKLRTQLYAYRRLQQAAPVWKNVLAGYQRQAPQIKARLIAEINSDLRRRSLRMVHQLEDIAENLQLVEVEMYNGASQDIIWQNAHPEYRQLAQQMKEEREKAAAEKVWDWGRAPATSDEANAEIWEDELGSFKADLFDNCSSKDKYIALKMKERSR